MGKAVNKKIENANPKIIDYANSKFRSDFLDIFLGYRCSFCIRTAGFGGVPEIFRKPLVVNEGPIVDLCGDLPRIELFARQEWSGWDHWGNEL